MNIASARAFDLLGIHMPDDKKNDEVGEVVSRVVQTWIVPIVTGITIAVCLGVGGAALGLWRSEPMTAADVAQVKSEAAQLRASHDAMIQRVVALEADMRQRAIELGQMQKTLDKIEAYNSRTMTEVQQINLQLAEMRGAKKK